MPNALRERLRAHGYVPPDYDGGGLLNVAATVLALCGARGPADPPPLRGVDQALLDGVRTILLVLCDGLGSNQLRRLAASGDLPFLARILDRAARHEAAQLVDATTIFPSTTAAAITTLQTARTPQEHGNIAYFLWLEEFAMVAQMLGQAYITAHHLIEHNKEAVEQIAQVVIERKELHGNELLRLLDQANLKVPTVDLTKEEAWPAIS